MNNNTLCAVRRRAGIKWGRCKKYNIRMIVDDTIATIYVDGVALNARAYKRPGESLSLFASEGSLKVTNCKVTTGLKK